MNNQNEDKCIYCQALDFFDGLLEEGAGFNEAFHIVMRTLVEDTYDDAFEDGLSTGLNLASNNLKNLISHIENPCDCETCTGECDETCH